MADKRVEEAKRKPVGELERQVEKNEERTVNTQTTIFGTSNELFKINLTAYNFYFDVPSATLATKSYLLTTIT